MIDALERARAAAGTVIPSAINFYREMDHCYAVMMKVNDTDYHEDNKAALHTDTIQVDIWQRDKRPFAESQAVRIALVGAGFEPRSGGDESSEQANGKTWHRISRDFDFTQEVDE